MVLRITVIALLIASARTVDAGTVTPLRCPERLTVEGRVEAPKRWVADSGFSAHGFERISVISGEIGEQRKPAPADLAPDQERVHGDLVTQAWRLADYHDGGLVLVCRYAGTRATLSIALPKELTLCEQTFRRDAKTRLIAPDPAPTMMCR